MYFKDYGKAVYDKDKIGNAPRGYQKIRVHFVLTENAVEALSKGPSCCFENAPNTALTIVLIINAVLITIGLKYLILVKEKLYSNEVSDNVLLCLCFVSKIIASFMM